MTETEFEQFFESIPPSDLAKARGTRQDTSTRDRKRFLNKIEEIQKIANFFDVQIVIKTK